MSIVRLALPGNDVRRVRVQDSVLDNRYPNPKISTKANPPHTGIIYLTWNDTTGISLGTVKILHPFPHKYNGVPTVFAAYNFNNGATIRKGTLPFQLGALGFITIDADASGNINLKYISIDTNVTPASIPAFTMQIRFYVMAEAGMA